MLKYKWDTRGWDFGNGRAVIWRYLGWFSRHTPLMHSAALRLASYFHCGFNRHIMPSMQHRSEPIWSMFPQSMNRITHYQFIFVVQHLHDVDWGGRAASSMDAHITRSLRIIRTEAIDFCFPSHLAARLGWRSIKKPISNAFNIWRNYSGTKSWSFQFFHRNCFFSLW